MTLPPNDGAEDTMFRSYIAIVMPDDEGSDLRYHVYDAPSRRSVGRTDTVPRDALLLLLLQTAAY